jgi:uncharacterized protein (DUF433 family)
MCCAVRRLRIVIRVNNIHRSVWSRLSEHEPAAYLDQVCHQSPSRRPMVIGIQWATIVSIDLIAGTGRIHMSELHRITSDPDVCGGRPTLRGTRMRVKDILDLLASGATRDEILEDYPYVEAEDITAALQYAAAQTDQPVIRTA